MKKTVLTFGLIAGIIMSAMMAATVPFFDKVSFEKGAVIGYTTMVLAFLLVYFGIRSYRDNVGGGTISFGRAFGIGILIVAIASLCYTATWQVIYHNYMPDFMEKYGQAQVDQARAEGKSEAEIAAVKAEAAKNIEQYKNPVYNMAITFLEPLPVGLIITLVSAGILRRKRRDSDTVFATA
jgi:hypothetical protein